MTGGAVLSPGRALLSTRLEDDHTLSATSWTAGDVGPTDITYKIAAENISADHARVERRFLSVGAGARWLVVGSLWRRALLCL